MIAEHDDRVVAKRANVAQHLERLRPAIDEIAYEPQLIAIRRELQPLDERAQLCIAALDIANRVARQESLLQDTRHGEPERRDRGVEALAVVAQHLIAALHGAHRSLNHGAA